jgi:hypothetical protein
MKKLLFVGYVFSHKRDNKPSLKPYMKIIVLFVYRLLPRRAGFVG